MTAPVLPAPPDDGLPRIVRRAAPDPAGAPAGRRSMAQRAGKGRPGKGRTGSDAPAARDWPHALDMLLITLVAQGEADADIAAVAASGWLITQAEVTARITCLRATDMMMRMAWEMRRNDLGDLQARQYLEAAE